VPLSEHRLTRSSINELVEGSPGRGRSMVMPRSAHMRTNSRWNSPPLSQRMIITGFAPVG